MGANLTIPDGFPFAGDQLEEVISPDELHNRVREIGREILTEPIRSKWLARKWAY